ncbi:hypothetical protein EJB05_09678 [Eragrostis curvula]|uniref:F-box domain-containing protein n=1 Tax=Eragrostis curvula TaxID=38414 RepID=A0A5J9W5K3_9POAL|nr:hypothetical protein EJB05_09678 [Eragrostis curvula]
MPRKVAKRGESSGTRGEGDGLGPAADRLSDLPDELLHHVMSFIKAWEVVRTCVLSRRWRYLWASAPCIDVRFRRFCEPVEDFAKFVYRLLLAREALAPVDTLRLRSSGTNDDFDNEDVKMWIRHAIKRNARVIQLSGLRNLFVELHPMDLVSRHLKILELSYADVFDKFTSQLPSGCPYLEELELKGCLVEARGIMSAALKSLTMINCAFTPNFTIDAPNLLFVRCIAPERFVPLFKNFGSLVTGSIMLDDSLLSAYSQKYQTSGEDDDSDSVHTSDDSDESSGDYDYSDDHSDGSSADNKENYDFGSDISSDSDTYEYSDIANRFEHRQFVNRDNADDSSKCSKYLNSSGKHAIGDYRKLVGQNVLHSLSSARNLELLGHSGEAILRTEAISCPTFSNLKTLALGEWCISMGADFDILITLLQHSPNLEKLILHIDMRCQDFALECPSHEKSGNAFDGMPPKVTKRWVPVNRPGEPSRGPQEVGIRADITADRLSALPDALLHHIMSFMKAWEVVRTCVLARRWRDLWASAPCVDVRVGRYSEAPEQFAKFVYRLMLARDILAPVDTLRLRSPGEDDDYDVGDDDVSMWIRSAIKRKARVIQLNGHLHESVKLDHRDFVSCHLKILKLSYAELDDQFVRQLCSRCPSLEELDLKRCVVEAREIASASLKSLSMVKCKFTMNLSVDAPNLVSLRCIAPEKWVPLFKNFGLLITASVMLDDSLLSSEFEKYQEEDEFPQTSDEDEENDSGHFKRSGKNAAASDDSDEYMSDGYGCPDEYFDHYSNDIKDDYDYGSDINSDSDTYEYSEIANGYDYRQFGNNDAGSDSSKGSKYHGSSSKYVINDYKKLGGQNILQTLSNAQCLDLLGHSGEVILRRESMSCPTFSNLKTLALGEWCISTGADFDIIVLFLQHSPNLEKLFLQLEMDFDIQKALGRSMKPKGGSFECKYLKMVKIRCTKDDPRVHMLAQLLRAQNGWSSEAWNLMVRKFQDQFPYVQLTKDQIQDKEKDLKRDFSVLKEARKQSGVHWDEKLCMIIVEPAIWANIIESCPKASKFQRKGFPLYDELDKLYAGKTAEGKFALISLKQKEDDEVRIVQPPKAKVTRDGAVDSLAFLSGYHDDYQHDDSDDDDVKIVQPNQRCAATSSKRDKRAADRYEELSASGAKVTSTTREKGTATQRDDDVPSFSRDKGAGSKAQGGKAIQKRKTVEDVADLMGKYVEVKTKQVEEEAAKVAEFSIKSCNALLATMEELSCEERADAYEVFMDARKRESPDAKRGLIGHRRHSGLVALDHSAFVSRHLKILKLSYAQIDDNLFKQLSSRCPTLEEMDLKDCLLSGSEISSSSLKTLILVKCNMFWGLTITAPNLVLLRCLSPIGQAPSFKNLESLVSGTIVLDDYCFASDYEDFSKDEFDGTTDDDSDSEVGMKRKRRIGYGSGFGGYNDRKDYGSDIESDDDTYQYSKIANECDCDGSGYDCAGSGSRKDGNHQVYGRNSGNDSKILGGQNVLHSLSNATSLELLADAGEVHPLPSLYLCHFAVCSFIFCNIET